MNDEFLPLIKSTLTNNQRETQGNFYTVPSDRCYPYQWLWDSCWHALIYSYYNPKLGEKEINTLLSTQWENGMIPHVIYWEKDHDVYPIDWGAGTNTTTLIQPPVIAYTAWRLYKATKNKTWLDDIYPKLLNWHEYLIRDRQLPNRPLYGIVNPDESGEDNSPRFDSELGLPPQHDVAENQRRRFALFEKHRENNFVANGGTHRHFWVEDVPFNIFAIASLESLSNIATELGDNDKAETLKARAKETRDFLRTHCLQGGLLLSARGPDKPLIEVDTWSHFAPMFIGLYSEAEAKNLVNNYLNNPKHFKTPYPLPTVSVSDPSFDGSEPDFGQPWQHPHWRGPVWMVVNWCVYHGLKNYGYVTEANELKEATATLIRQANMREYYHPTTGKGMGADRFTWAGLFLDMN